MAALAADVNASALGKPTLAPFAAAAADTFYRGSVVYIDTAGGVQPVWASGDIAIGYSVKRQVAAAAGDLVEVLIAGAIWLPVGSGVAAADEGDWLINDGPANSDNPADLVAAGDITLATGDMLCGRILRATATQMLVWVDPFWMGKTFRADTGTGDAAWI